MVPILSVASAFIIAHSLRECNVFSIKWRNLKFLLDNRALLRYTSITIVEVQQSEAALQGLMPLALHSTASLRDPTAALHKPNFYGSFSDASDLFCSVPFSQSQGLRCHVCRSPWL
jgi:hypothetical protein